VHYSLSKQWLFSQIALSNRVSVVMSSVLCEVKAEVWVILGAFAKLQKAAISFVVSVRPSEWNNSASTGRIFIKTDIWAFLKNLSCEFDFRQNLRRRIMGTLHEVPCRLMIISHVILIKVRNVSDRICRENQNTSYVQTPPPSKSRLYDRMWKKYGCFRQSTVGNSVQAPWMLDVKSTNFSSPSI
jgi:hypothetical protein